MEVEILENKETISEYGSRKKDKILLYFVETMISLGIIGILVPVIVDFSINKGLTWSLISGVSILFAYSGLIGFVLSKKKKWIKALAIYSVLLIPYLFVLETLIDYLYFNPSQNRFMDYALPISALWLAILWGAILISKITRMNGMFQFSLLFLLAIVGTSATNAIAYKISWAKTFSMLNQEVELLAYAACAIVFFVLGIFKKMNRRFF